jgi:ABC-type transport system involved in cytochrome c biogenesis permease subunit
MINCIQAFGDSLLATANLPFFKIVFIIWVVVFLLETNNYSRLDTVRIITSFVLLLITISGGRFDSMIYIIMANYYMESPESMVVSYNFSTLMVCHPIALMTLMTELTPMTSVFIIILVFCARCRIPVSRGK